MTQPGSACELGGALFLSPSPQKCDYSAMNVSSLTLISDHAPYENINDHFGIYDLPSILVQDSAEDLTLFVPQSLGKYPTKQIFSSSSPVGKQPRASSKDFWLDLSHLGNHPLLDSPSSQEDPKHSWTSEPKRRKNTSSNATTTAAKPDALKQPIFDSTYDGKDDTPHNLIIAETHCPTCVCQPSPPASPCATRLRTISPNERRHIAQQDTPLAKPAISRFPHDRRGPPSKPELGDGGAIPRNVTAKPHRRHPTLRHSPGNGDLRQAFYSPHLTEGGFDTCVTSNTKNIWTPELEREITIALLAEIERRQCVSRESPTIMKTRPTSEPEPSVKRQSPLARILRRFLGNFLHEGNGEDLSGLLGFLPRVRWLR